ncbi:PREDICTED: ethylene-responsive transcription factor-like protein At4g13040 isoform X1 [Camelina sativa]|uniref:Ethylene-responsive transcription factor-like protein At4g13040 isoform X1 n=1 Tax=Camelina sativa TaxID=90675 RepID=A0ABM0V3M9_CAMSA|nr:PREDICTED: ethylene-responsive transcription factor-like protein At4g13040 isoform X1 [Camelina sativa]
MVSSRRRRLLGLCCGPNGYVTPLPFLTAEEMITGIPNPNAKAAYSLGPAETVNEPKEEKMPIEEAGRRTRSKHMHFSFDYSDMSPVDSDSISPKCEQNICVPDQPLKRRKRHKRKQVHNQEPCLMRGVYYKNMKWQAAIKVDKRQIHLGTFSSQEEAARLYDRAAFMCGREPNFALSEEDKRELKQQSWEEFLACARRTITNKKPKRRIEHEDKEINVSMLRCPPEEEEEKEQE